MMGVTIGDSQRGTDNDNFIDIVCFISCIMYVGDRCIASVLGRVLWFNEESGLERNQW